ncbi:MAG: hypothetical protein AAF415_15015 [Pseudomonadota bacterium]
MKAALLITSREGCDARLAQSAGLYAKAGYHVDLVLAQGETRDAELPFNPRRLAVAHPSALPGLAARLNRESPLGIVQLDSAAMPGVSVPEIGHGLRVLDHKDAAIAVSNEARHADLVLTSSETSRQRLRAAGAPAVRLPMALDRPASRRLHDTGRVGWFGTWDAALAEGWREVLAALRHQATLLPRAALLGGKDVDRVDLGRARSNATLVRRPRAGNEGFLACDVALMPANSVDGREDAILAALSRGCPVLLLESAAAPFEDRWHLPTAATTEDLARLLGRALTGDVSDRAWLMRGLHETVAALQRDQAAMERHIMAKIEAMTVAI